MSAPIRKIMVYIDGTEQSITAAQYAICLAASCGAELFVQHVVNTRAVEELLKARIFLKDEQIEYERDMEADAWKYLDYIGGLAARKGVSITKKSSKGSIHNEIIDAVRENGVDLLIIGELSRIGSRRDELYDESEQAMRAVPCSVLIVKDQERVSQMYESLE